MFRTIKFVLEGDINALYRTAELYREACQTCLIYGYENITWKIGRIFHGTYDSIRFCIPELPSVLVQTAQCRASEMIRRVKNKKVLWKKALDVRYDRRSFKFYPDSEYIELSTVKGRLKYKIKMYDYARRYMKGADFSSGQLYMRNGRFYFNVLCKLDDPQINIDSKILGIDRGIRNISVCSDNSFMSGNKLRNTKGKYHYLRRKLQRLGTRSAIRKLHKLKGRERRFVLDTNHTISKQIVNKPFDVFVVERLKVKRSKKVGKVFNNRLGMWSYYDLLQFIKYKAGQLGKIVVEVDSRFTSQKCSKCGYIYKLNRRYGKFKCQKCGFELNADINAARNIAHLGKSEVGRLYADEPIVTAVASHK